MDFLSFHSGRNLTYGIGARVAVGRAKGTSSASGPNDNVSTSTIALGLRGLILKLIKKEGFTLLIVNPGIHTGNIRKKKPRLVIHGNT